MEITNEKSKILDAINEKTGGLKCTLCGSEDYTLVDYKACIFFPKEQTLTVLGKSIPSKRYYVMTCKHCGNSLFFDENIFE